MNVYAAEFLNDKIIFEEKHRLASDNCDPKYIIPDDLTAKAVKQHSKGVESEPQYYAAQINDFPSIEKPEVFGQHINAEISS